MKKKKTNRVSKLMLAVCLLTASSGGIAWGQVLKSEENQGENHNHHHPKVQLRGGIGGGIDANASGQSCSTDYTVRTSFIVENNYGPGETGTLTPKGTANGSKNTGLWNAMDQGFNIQNGRITLGGTTNHVGHSTQGANYNSNLAGRGTSTGPVTASRNLYIYEYPYICLK